MLFFYIGHWIRIFPCFSPFTRKWTMSQKNNAFYKDYPVGTEFEAVWFNEDLLDSVRRKYKVEKIEPIQEQAQKTQDSNSSGKKKR